MSLLVRSPDQAEVLLEQKVALESQELPGHLALTIAHDLHDGDLRVVVADPRRHTARELKGANVPFQKRFRAFAWKQLRPPTDEGGGRTKAVVQGCRSRPSTAASSRTTPPASFRRSDARRRIRNRPELRPDGESEAGRLRASAVSRHSPRLGRSSCRRRPSRTDRSEHRVRGAVSRKQNAGFANQTALGGVLVAEPFEDPFRRMPLLPVDFPITLQNLVKATEEAEQCAGESPRAVAKAKRFQLRSPRLSPAITWRFRIRQNLLQCLPVNLLFRTSRPLTDLVVQNSTTDLSPFLHVREHPRLPLFSRSELLKLWKV